jgi:hypothetical protein
MGLFGKKKSGSQRGITWPLPILLVRFDIRRCGDIGGYGDDCCQHLLDALSMEDLELLHIRYGDSDLTLSGLENVFIIGLSTPDAQRLKNEIQPRLAANKDLLARCSDPALLMCPDGTNEPLMEVGSVINGKLNKDDNLMASRLKKKKAALEGGQGRM